MSNSWKSANIAWKSLAVVTLWLPERKKERSIELGLYNIQVHIPTCVPIVKCERLRSGPSIF
jgi:hypothetical protein